MVKSIKRLISREMVYFALVCLWRARCICYLCDAHDLDLVESLIYCIQIACGLHLVESVHFFWMACGWHIAKSWFDVFVLHESHTLCNSASATWYKYSVVCTLHVVWTLRTPALLSLHCMSFNTESGYQW